MRPLAQPCFQLLNHLLPLMARLIALALLAYFGGNALAQFIAYNLIYEMPQWMYSTIRFVLDHTGNQDIREPDDISILGLFSVLAASWVFVAIAIMLLYRGFRRFMHKRRHADTS